MLHFLETKIQPDGKLRRPALKHFTALRARGRALQLHFAREPNEGPHRLIAHLTMKRREQPLASAGLFPESGVCEIQNPFQSHFVAIPTHSPQSVKVESEVCDAQARATKVPSVYACSWHDFPSTLTAWGKGAISSRRHVCKW